MKKCLFILFLSAVFPLMVYNQQDQLPSDKDQLIVPQNEDTDQDQDKVSSLKDRIDTDLEVGTSFSFSPRNFYGPSYYISPSISFRVTPRFFISSGVGMQYSTFYPLYQSSESVNKMLPMTQAYLFARGSYFISPRLVINGTVYKSMGAVPQLYKNSRGINYNYQGMSVGFHYKVSKSFSLGFQMNMQNSSYRDDGLIPASGYVPVPGF